MRIADDLRIFQSVGLSVTRRVLASDMGALYSMLAMQNKSATIKAALKFLISMVMQGDTAAQEVMLQFDFQHYTFSPLFDRTDSRVG